MTELPRDPFMLLSAVNMKLRDEFDSLDELCASLDIDRADLERRLADAGFIYLPAPNQFR
ncbi:MAG: DUF4250 domain-containing protein [Muribaculaceae bacterium]|nr:DUF4250 domain-containing protein [Muribaculaceae bacterium]